jgi:hypothetical protein
MFSENHHMVGWAVRDILPIAEIKGFGSLGAFFLEDLGWDI